MKNVILSLTFLVIVMCTSQLHAASSEPPALPAGNIFTLAGEPLATDGIGKDAGVLLVLLKNGNSGGEQLLTFIEGLKTPPPAGSLLVVAGGADEGLLKMMAARHAKLQDVWYRDTDDLLSKGLALKASPVVMGVRDGRVFWTKFGMANRDLLEKTMQGWLNR
jgi:hypothetical protein